MNARVPLSVLFVALQCSTVTAGAEHAAAVDAALHYLEALTAGGDGSPFAGNWPKPISGAERDAVVAALPSGQDGTPGANQRAKVAALAPVLTLFDRQQTVIVKIVPLPWAAIAFHARCVLIIANSALDALTASELQAIAAHELAHEYLWQEYYAARSGGDVENLQRIELICDGIAIAALARLSVPAHVLPSGIQ
jgi:hypothetical protein